MKLGKMIAMLSVALMLTAVSCQKNIEVVNSKNADSTAVDSLVYDSVTTSHKSDTILVKEGK